METNNTILSSGNGILQPKKVIADDSGLDHGNEVTEIISNKPPFWVRWGILFFFFLLLMIALISWFIQYPDIVSANGVLNSVNAPKAVISLSGGKLVKLFVKESQSVAAGEILGYMESTADHKDVIALSELIDSSSIKMTKQPEGDITTTILSASFTNLGELQSDYQVFNQACISFSDYLRSGFYVKKRNMLMADMNNLQRLHSTLLQQKELYRQDLNLTDTTFRANEILKEQKVISALEYRNEKSKRIAKQMSLPQVSSSIISNEGQQNEKRKEIAELENQIRQQGSIFIQAMNTFKSRVDDWKKKYLLIAPISGAISFSAFLQENQQLKPGQIICYVNPGNTNYYVEALIQQYNFGKVKKGQQVLLKFPAYPYHEFGTVKGVVELINATPSDSGYLAKVSLPEGLITNYKKQLRYNDRLPVQADIITENLNLLQRVFYNFRKNMSQ